MAYHVVLTGGIACGKTTISDLFARLNIDIIDTDSIARELVKPGLPCYQHILAHFGPDYLLANQTLNRPKLRQHIFQSQKDKQALEEILHPAIRECVARQCQHITSPYGLIVVPLFVEQQEYYPVQRVLVVDCSEQRQLQRLTERDGLTTDFARKILNQQANRRKRLAIADDVVNNNSSITDLSARITHLDYQYRAFAMQI